MFVVPDKGEWTITPVLHDATAVVSFSLLFFSYPFAQNVVSLCSSCVLVVNFHGFDMGIWSRMLFLNIFLRRR